MEWHVVAVVLAGGVGARVGGDRPKQLLEVAGRPLMAWSLEAFDAHPGVDEIVLVMHPDHLDTGRDLSDGFGKVTRVLPGGTTRSDSTQAALAALDDPDTLVLVHDAARPLVTARMIDDCLAALADHDAVGTVIDSADTLWQVEGNALVGIPERSTLRRVQTPQGFRLTSLRAAYDRANGDPNFQATDDCAVVFGYCPEMSVALVAGDERNLKITTPADLTVAEVLLG